MCCCFFKKEITTTVHVSLNFRFWLWNIKVTVSNASVYCSNLYINKIITYDIYCLDSMKSLFVLDYEKYFLSCFKIFNILLIFIVILRSLTIFCGFESCNQ